MNVIIKPIITEKMTALSEKLNRYAFRVARDANKIEIKKAVEAAFKVKVKAVNIITRSPQAKKRQGRKVGKIAGWKKAYVTLAAGEKIEFFEGV